MLLLTCPFCGERDESEFVFGGPLRARREKLAGAGDTEWIAWLTVAPNPKGPVREKWCHAHGCGTWMTIERDTLTHRIISTGATSHGRA